MTWDIYPGTLSDMKRITNNISIYARKSNPLDIIRVEIPFAEFAFFVFLSAI